MWVTLLRLQKDRMSEGNLLSPSFAFVKKVDPYLIYLICIKKCRVVKSHFCCAITVLRGGSTTRNPAQQEEIQ